MTAVDIVLLVGGLVVIVASIADLVITLVATTGGYGRWRPTNIFYRRTWAAWTAIARRIRSPQRRERFLAVYGPGSLLILLVLWLVTLLLGWSLVWGALDHHLEGEAGVWSLAYYSGVVLFTLGFGDITPTSSVARVLTMSESASGLLTVALVISYLPTLYGAFGRRETKLLTLDHPSGDRITPTALIALHSPEGDLGRLYRFFGEWEMWVAEVLESHVAFPMLALFRSRHAGQSWITALGVVVDAAALTSAAVPGADEREAFFVYRRGQRTLVEIASRLCPEAQSEPPPDRAMFEAGYKRLQRLDLPLRDVDDCWQRWVSYRSGYGPALEGLISYLVAPRGFWGHSAGADLSDPLRAPAATPADTTPGVRKRESGD